MVIEGTAMPKMKLEKELDINDPEAFIRTMLIHKKGTEKDYITYGSENGDVVVIHPEDQKNEVIHNHSELSVLSLLVITSKDWLLSTARDKNIHVYDLANKKNISTLTSVKEVIYDFETVDDEYIVGVDESGDVFSWEISTKIEDKPTTLLDYGKPLRSLAYNPQKKLVAVAGSDGKINLFPFQNKKVQRKNLIVLARRHSGIVSRLVFSPDGKWLASASFEGTIMLWDLETKDFDRVVPVNIENPNPVFSLAFDSESKYLIFGDNKRLNIRTLDIHLAYQQLKEKVGDVQLTDQEWSYYIKGDVKLSEENE